MEITKPRRTLVGYRPVIYQQLPGTVKLVIEKIEGFADLNRIKELYVEKVIPADRPGFHTTVQFVITILAERSKDLRFASDILNSGLFTESEIAQYQASEADFDRVPLDLEEDPTASRSPSYSPRASPSPGSPRSPPSPPASPPAPRRILAPPSPIAGPSGYRERTRSPVVIELDSSDSD